MAEQSAVNRSVVGSSPIVSATGLLEKRLNSYPFQGYIHGFESRTGHHLRRIGLIQFVSDLFSLQIGEFFLSANYMRLRLSDFGRLI